jgi:hypothetical protein
MLSDLSSRKSILRRVFVPSVIRKKNKKSDIIS